MTYVLVKPYFQMLTLFEYSFILLLAKPAHTFNESQERHKRNIIQAFKFKKIAPAKIL